VIGPNLSEWAIRSRALTIYLMIVAVLAGGFAFANLGRDEDPTFTIKVMLVAAVWPGATMEEQLSQVTERLERTLQETPGLDSVRSITRPGVTTIFVDLLGAWPPEEVPDSWYHVRKSVADIRHTLPQGVVGPFFNDEFGDVFGIIYGFTADGFDQRELLDYVDGARSTLLREVEGIAKIEFIGVQDERIFIELAPDRVAALGLDYGQIFAAVAAQNVVRPSGTISTGLENLSLQVSGAFESERDVLEVAINAGGRMIRLGDIADVRRGFVDPPSPLFHVNGERAIGLAISQRPGGDVLELGRDVRAAMARITADLPIGIEPFLVNDQPAVVDASIGDFTTSLYQAVAIILAVSFLAIGLRPGAMVAIAIPVTLATVFLVMQTLGIDLHRVSLGALIIALALLVDDAMTTTDAMLRRLAVGDPIDKAATFAYRTLAAPMLTGTLITIAGFVPIGFAESQAGEYTISLFQVIAIALIASWMVAVLFTPIVGGFLLKPPKPGEAEAPPGFLVRHYERLLRLAIRAPVVVIVAAAVLFALSVIGLQRVDQQFFPASDRNELIVDLQLPRSSSIFASEAAVSRIEAWLGANEDVDFWSAYIGSNVIRFYLPLAIESPSDHQSQIVVMATDLAARQRLERDLDTYLTEEFPEAIARVSPLEMGPPIGWPVQYRLSGPDLEVLRREAFELAGVIAAHPGAQRVHFDWIEPARKLTIDVDQDQARRLGLTSQALSAVLNTAVSGAPITQLRDGIYLVDVVARAHSQDRVTLDSLATLQVPVPGGRTVALSSFATFAYEQEQPLVRRRDRGADPHRARRRRPRRDARGGGGGDRGRHRRARRGPAGRLPDRARRHRRAERAEQRVGVRRGAAHALHHADPADGAAAELLEGRHGPRALSARPHRRGARAPDLRPAAGVRGDPRHPRPARDDREERGDPAGADQGRDGAWAERARRGDRGGDRAAPPDHAHRALHRARPHADRPDPLLGADGDRDHGRPLGGDAADAGVPAGALRAGVRARRAGDRGRGRRGRMTEAA
jgi:multidrug efflux pump